MEAPTAHEGPLRAENGQGGASVEPLGRLPVRLTPPPHCLAPLPPTSLSIPLPYMARCHCASACRARPTAQAEGFPAGLPATHRPDPASARPRACRETAPVVGTWGIWGFGERRGRKRRRGRPHRPTPPSRGCPLSFASVLDCWCSWQDSGSGPNGAWIGRIGKRGKGEASGTCATCLVKVFALQGVLGRLQHADVTRPGGAFFLGFLRNKVSCLRQVSGLGPPPAARRCVCRPIGRAGSPCLVA